MVQIPKEKRKKLDAKATKMFFVSYNFNKKGYRCFNPSTNEFIVSRDVKFIHEDTKFPIKIYDDVYGAEEETTHPLEEKEEQITPEDNSQMFQVIHGC